MHARVLLLILVTAVFMAAWNGDRAAMQASIVRSIPQHRHSVGAAETAQPQRRALTHQLTRSPLQTVSAAVAQATTHITNFETVPLPNRIAPGTYQAVSQSGTTFRLEVSQAQHTQPRDRDMVDAKNGDHWYLVRITEERR